MAKEITESLKRNNILEALMTAKNIEEASNLAGVSRKTIYQYLNNDIDLITQYRNIKREQLRELSESLSESTETALKNIIDIAEDKNTPPFVKLQANLKVIELFMKIRQVENGINEKIYQENKSPYELEEKYFM